MGVAYFHRVHRETPTRVWVNNPSASDLEQAIAAGAIAGTTNPAYGSKLLQGEPDYIRGVIDEVLAHSGDADDGTVADLVYQRIAARFMAGFAQLYRDSDGSAGFVTMQDDPRCDERSSDIVAAAMRHRDVGPNYMAKVPVTAAGMEALTELMDYDIPLCATEVFTISQAVAMCEAYEEASRRSGKSPPLYLTHITGIYDEELSAQAAAGQIHVSADVLAQAGTIVARKEYRLLKERGYRATMLGGGARGTHHFTELVGGDAHITINWSTFEELIDADPPVVSRIDAHDSEEIVAELRAKVPDFRSAYDQDALEPEEFASFSALLRFRRNFIDGCDALLAEVSQRRQLVPS